MKIRSKQNLFDSLEKEIAWRKLELQSLSTMQQEAVGGILTCLIRASVVMLYAHWEGFIKNSSEMYLEYIQSRYLTHGELQCNLAAVSLKKYILDLRDTKRYSLITSAYKIISDSGSNRAHIPSSVHTKSNLKKDIFEEILHLLGLDIDPYSTALNFIDSLVETRNSIAHGEHVNIKHANYKEMENRTLLIMEQMKGDIMQHCSCDSFKKVSEI